jgi:hypothetical protein
MLLVKTLRRRHTKKKKVRSRYSVTSRNKTVKANKEKAEKKTLDTLMSDETANEDSEEQTAEEETADPGAVAEILRVRNPGFLHAGDGDPAYQRGVYLCSA